MLADTGRNGRPQRGSTLGVAPQLKRPIGEGGSTIRIHEPAAASRLDNLRKRTATRLHDGNTTRHRFEQEQSFRLVVGGRDRQDVEALEKIDLLRSSQLATVFEF